MSQSSDFAICAVTADRWWTLRDVRLAALADSPQAFGSTLAAEQRFDEQRWRELSLEAHVLVASSGRELIGTVAGLRRSPFGLRGLGAMWVSPSWRQRGVGSALLEGVLQWARIAGAERVSLWAPSGSIQAVRFYERHGFIPTGMSKPFPNDTSRTANEMIHHLTC